MPDLRSRLHLAAAALAGALLALAPAATAQTYATADEVMDAVNAQPSPPALVSTMTMTITTGSGQSLSRTMQVWSAGDGDRQLVKFTAPADIKGSGFLALKQPDGTTESMIYLPALDRVRRIAGSQKQEAFFGSDFSYEDISGLRDDTRDDYDTSLLAVKDGPTYVIEATAKPGADTSYDRLVLEIPESLLLPTRVEFFRGGEKLKVMTIGATTTVDGYLLPTELRMETTASGSSTTIEQGEFTVQDSLPDDVFSERYLRR